MAIKINVPELRELKPRIVVLGVGGAGGNAINNMIDYGIQGVEFVAANTDAQALKFNKAGCKIQLGTNLTRGLGAGAKSDIGQAAAEETLNELINLLQGANMVFITAGMGGGTGTGAAPVIARAAKDLNLLTVAVVTKPFIFEGPGRLKVAERGLEELKKAEKFGADILKYCVKVGGVLTGEHGVGIEKRDLMCEMFNDEDIQFQKTEYVKKENVIQKINKVVTEIDSSELDKIIDLIYKSKKPIIYSGGGVVNSGDKASALLQDLVRMTGFPITSTLQGLGAFPGDDQQFLGMLGMHGTFEANNAMHDCDLLCLPQVCQVKKIVGFFFSLVGLFCLYSRSLLTLLSGRWTKASRGAVLVD